MNIINERLPIKNMTLQKAGIPGHGSTFGNKFYRLYSLCIMLSINLDTAFVFYGLKNKKMVQSWVHVKSEGP